MILTLDVGNSHIYGGVFENEVNILQFRKPSSYTISSDEMGVFFRSVLRENDIDPTAIKHIAVCSVVPDLDHSIRNCCLKYFKKNPFFLKSGIKTGISIKYKNPSEVGADRIANSIAATTTFKDQNLIIVDFGTATTFCAITKDRAYLGGVIAPGPRLWMESLEANTAKLPKVEIKKTNLTIGKTTVESIQTGIYFGHLGMTKEIISNIIRDEFSGEKPVVIGTGGFSRLFEDENIFDHIDSNLVHKGLLYALKMNI
jgi:type III pantothenate kinase